MDRILFILRKEFVPAVERLLSTAGKLVRDLSRMEYFLIKLILLGG